MNLNIKIFLIALFFLGVNCSSYWQEYSSAFTNREFDSSQFEGWQTPGFAEDLVSTCNGITYVGGHDIAANGATLSKTFTDIPYHTRVKITAHVLYGDSWDYEDFIVNVDGTEKYRERSNWNLHHSMCDNTRWGEYFKQIDIEFTHNSDTLELSFTSTLNQEPHDENWGLRNLYIYTQECEGDCEMVSEEFTTDNFDQTDIQGWTPSRDVGNDWVTECDGMKMVGGYGNFGQRFTLSKQFTGLSDHSEIFLGFDLFQMDSWDTNEVFTVTIDGVTALQQAKSLGPHGGQYACSSSANWRDELISISLEIPHTASELTIQFSDNLNENSTNESWGFKNFRLYTFGSTGVSELQQTSFDSSAVTGWTDQNGNEYNTVTTCGDSSIIGGYGQLAAGASLSKTFADLPEHDTLIVSIEVWFIDTWDNESLFILVDGTAAISSTKGNVNNSRSQGQFCGVSGSDDQSQILSFTVPHIYDSTTISITSRLDQGANDESWGIRNVSIDYTTENETELASQDFSGSIDTYSEDWEVVSADGSAVFHCDNQALMGKFDGSGSLSRTFALPGHSSITFNFSIYLLDGWDQEILIVEVDDEQFTYISASDFNTANQQLCGSSAEDKSMFYTISFPHNRPTAHLSIRILTEETENIFWGVKDFFLTYTPAEGSESYEIYEAPEVPEVPEPTEDSESSGSTRDCIILYSECDYQGEHFSMCENIPNFDAQGWDGYQTKSIHIPEGIKIKLFNSTHYHGEPHLYTESVSCLENGPFVASLLQLPNINVSGKYHQKIHHQHKRDSHFRRN